MPPPSLLQAHLTLRFPRHPSYVTYFISSQYQIPPTSSRPPHPFYLPPTSSSCLIPPHYSLMPHPSYHIHPTSSFLLIPRFILPTSSFLTHPSSTPCLLPCCSRLYNVCDFIVLIASPSWSFHNFLRAVSA